MNHVQKYSKWWHCSKLSYPFFPSFHLSNIIILIKFIWLLTHYYDKVQLFGRRLNESKDAPWLFMGWRLSYRLSLSLGAAETFSGSFPFLCVSLKVPGGTPWPTTVKKKGTILKRHRILKGGPWQKSFWKSWFRSRQWLPGLVAVVR